MHGVSNKAWAIADLPWDRFDARKLTHAPAGDELSLVKFGDFTPVNTTT